MKLSALITLATLAAYGVASPIAVGHNDSPKPEKGKDFHFPHHKNGTHPFTPSHKPKPTPTYLPHSKSKKPEPTHWKPKTFSPPPSKPTPTYTKHWKPKPTTHHSVKFEPKPAPTPKPEGHHKREAEAEAEAAPVAEAAPEAVAEAEPEAEAEAEAEAAPEAAPAEVWIYNNL